MKTEATQRPCPHLPTRPTNLPAPGLSLTAHKFPLNDSPFPTSSLFPTLKVVPTGYTQTLALSKRKPSSRDSLLLPLCFLLTHPPFHPPLERLPNTNLQGDALTQLPSDPWPDVALPASHLTFPAARAPRLSGFPPLGSPSYLLSP